MSTNKYGKYIIREPLGTFANLHPELTGIENFVVEGKQWGIQDCHMGMTAVDKPFLMEKKPHKHPNDEFLCFIAGDPMNLRDFGAEIELCLGEEQEKHIINSSTVVYIPRDFPHCPLDFKVVKRPVVFLVFMPAGEYVKIYGESH
jgi:hypothetical protein